MEAPLRIEVEPAAVALIWEDGDTTTIPASDLRAACPCAGCREGASHSGTATIEAARVVGDYALNVTFGPDHHATGIFPYDLLRGLGKAS
ncbi:MAG TPA: DUF971 domain-containing protein [Acidimicrobiia bacterium]|nr:DUF971 domain-containing protein [Acidimicrobiia bacterium]